MCQHLDKLSGFMGTKSPYLVWLIVARNVPLASCQGSVRAPAHVVHSDNPYPSSLYTGTYNKSIRTHYSTVQDVLPILPTAYTYPMNQTFSVSETECDRHSQHPC